MSDFGNRTVKQVIPYDSPIIVAGHRVGVTINHRAIIRDVPAWSMWLPDTTGKYVPLTPIGKVASVDGTAITMNSAGEADYFDPTDSDINPYWLTANGGAQSVCYYDKSSSRTVVGISVASMGEVYTQSKAVVSVDDTTLNIGEAFTAAPAANDYILPGGIEGSSIHKQAIIIPEAVTIDELREKQSDFTAIGYGEGTVLGYDKLNPSVKDLYSAGIIVTDAAIKIDLTK